MRGTLRGSPLSPWRVGLPSRCQLDWGHPLSNEVGVDKARLISVCSSVRLDDSDKRLEKLNIVSVAGVMALVIGANLVLCLFECPGALLPCTEVAAVSSNKSQ